ncbi:MAG: AI-2E family transporter [Alphaproteobacteria bacterium]|nr:AI-2E family transporter [Alphaproteobacteria bacterium]
MNDRAQILAWTAGLVLFCLLTYLLRGVLLPFVAGITIAYFFDPVADRLKRSGLPRSLAAALVVVAVFLAAILVGLLLAPLVQGQLDQLLQRVPRFVQMLREQALPSIVERLQALGLSIEGDMRQAVAGVAGDAVAFLGKLLGGALSGGAAILNLLALLLITPVVAFYLLRDFDLIVARVDGWLPLQHRTVIRELFSRFDDVLAGFVRGQGTTCLILAAYYATALTLIGLDFGLIIGLLTGLLNFVPFVGVMLGMALSFVTLFSQFGWEIVHFLLLAAIFAAGQVADGYWLTPRIVGRHTGLHPVWIMFALLAGGSLFGFVGVLLAVPLAAVMGVMLRFLLAHYLHSPLFHGGAKAAGDQPP